jgi:parvulin-like peptidyl-prolyl isomerase
MWTSNVKREAQALRASAELQPAFTVMEPQATSRRAPILLAIGAAIGIVLAATGLVNVKRQGSALPLGVAARVNGEIIRSADYQRTLAGVASDRRDGVDAGERRQVLDRLIDEELLVQRGIELGLPRHDRKVRADLTAAVIASAIAGSDDVQPTESQLQAFYDENRGFFTRPGRLRLRQVFFGAATDGNDGAVRARAAEASRRLRAGEAFGTVREALGDPEVSPLPDALLPAEKLIDYLGPTVLKAALALAAGEVSDAVRSGTGYHVLQVIERQPDVTPPLAEIRSQVVTECRRRAGDQALRAYLNDLRARATIAVDPKLQ